MGAITAFYREILEPESNVLDLMGSWISHLPKELKFEKVIGHGLNRAELTANAGYSEIFVQDLNQNQKLPLENSSVDFVLNCASFQYLQRPVQVWEEVKRILRPRGKVIITFSNRMFPTKAVKIWRILPMGDHAVYVASVLKQAGFRLIEKQHLVRENETNDPVWVVSAMV